MFVCLYRREPSHPQGGDNAPVVMGKPNPATERRQKIVDYLTAALTDPSCPIEPDEWGHFNYVSIIYGTRDMFNTLAAGFDEWPVMKEEILVTMLVEVLNRLTE